MPLTATREKTAAGTAYVRTFASGAVAEADAVALTAALASGGPFEKLPILGLVESGATFSPEARKAFTSSGDGATAADRMPTAIVVNNAPLRVMLGFVIRISGASAQTRFFGAEAEALAWIDEQMAPKAP